MAAAFLQNDVAKGTQTQAHVQMDGRVNTWNGNSTISINVGWW